MPATAYSALIDRYRDIQAIEAGLGLMNWDRQVLMPPGGATARSAQTTILSRMAHQLTTSDETRRLLENAEKEAAPESEEAAACRVFRLELDSESKLPTELVERRAKVSGDAYEVWKKARAESDFAAMRPYYEEHMKIARETSQLLDPNAAHPYDPMIDLYEEGAKIGDAQAMFDAIKGPIVDLVKQIQERGCDAPDTFLYGNWDTATLRNVAQEITAHIGFDYNRGRLDVATSAFCGGTTRGDIRMTTKPSEHVKGVLSSSLHEMGHGVYEQGSPENWDRTPLAGGTSLAVHESQSRMWENIVARTRSFWTYFLPVLQRGVPALANLDLDTFCRALNKVQPGFIRVGADELTYNLHILIRFEIEVLMITGAIEAKDLPEVWNAKYAEYLGVTPTNDAVGVLQDVHWARGSCGYFPTYSMGNLIGAQVWATLKKDIPDTCDLMKVGEYGQILSWLQDKIYSKGKRYQPKELVMRVTGEPMNAKHWLDYATEKFSAIYEL